MKTKAILVGILVLAGVLHSVALAAGEPTINFFYSETCPHCIREQGFLDNLEDEYPDLVVNRYSVGDQDNIPLLKKMVTEAGADRYLGSVPMTFIGDDFYVGFDNEDGIGAKIIASIESQTLSGGTEDDTGNQENVEGEVSGKKAPSLPIIGEVDTSKYSFPALAVILGTLDGFNICSLGALILILGFALVLRSRKKIALYGGVFILTTVAVYGALIFLWIKLFSFVSIYVGALEIIVGTIGMLGGAYFVREFMRMKKFGVSCDSNGVPIIGKVTERIEKKLNSNKGLVAMLGSVLLFAGVVTIVEFPCSAAVPVFFAGLLANAGLSKLAYTVDIGIYMLFYMLDELIVFAVAVYKMGVWMTSPKFVKWVTLVEGIVLFALGGFYALSVIF